MSEQNYFGAESTLSTGLGEVKYYSITKLGEELGVDIDKLPFSIRILLENVLRNYDGHHVTVDNVKTLAGWKRDGSAKGEVPYKPSRVILQDFTGVPCVADLAAMRGVVGRMGGSPEQINPIVPVDLVIDHSVQVDFFGTADSFQKNVEREYERNGERYAFLRWATNSFDNFSVVPPGTGIVHQVNLERLATVVQVREQNGELVAFPDTLVGTDSHTTMINALSVLGWGVGGIEAEACMLGQPLYMLMPEVVGVKFTGKLAEGLTATDLVLTVTQKLREKGVVGKFVEFFGPGLSNLSLSDRATISNMSPEYGATMGFFPVDSETLRYLRLTARDEALVETVEKYTKAQKMFRNDDSPDPEFTDLLELDLSTVRASVAGPSRPQDKIDLADLKDAYHATMKERGLENGSAPSVEIQMDGDSASLGNGSVVIAAITSCTNTSNPSVMIGAGLVAKKCVELGLGVSPSVKTSLAPGSRVVTEYLEGAGLMPYLEKLGFDLVGYGCTTCIGNSGPLPDAVDQAVRDNDLTVASVLSGNRNFEGRIHPLVRLSYLASPPLVVALSIAGRVDIDVYNEPLAVTPEGKEVFLKDIWPTDEEVREAVSKYLTPEIFKTKYADVFEGDDLWKSMDTPAGSLYEWDEGSTYIQEPPFFDDFSLEITLPGNIKGARALAILGDSVTTDHISPAGSIPKDGPAGKYLISHGVEQRQFNSFGSRRGNHEVMMRGTFANIRLKNMLADGKEGGFTKYLPTGELMPIYDAVKKYKADGTPLVVIGGKEYGSGSSRDWAAKGSFLLNVKTVLAESYERIHRSNLVGMGVLPLQFKPGESAETWGLDGTEEFDFSGIEGGPAPGGEISVLVKKEDGSVQNHTVLCRLDSSVDVEYYQNGGILQTVLRNMLRS